MNESELNTYRCPSCKGGFELTVLKRDRKSILEGTITCPNNEEFTIKNGLPDLTWPRELEEKDFETKQAYEALAADYEKYADFPFRTYKVSEESVRERMIDQMNIGLSDTVLEIGCGDGRGSEFIARKLDKSGQLYVQELSPAFLRKAMQRLSKFSDIDIKYSIANACFIPFPDDHFDAAHHFGGINTFSDIRSCLSELHRVVKPGGKVIVGDESMAPWLRETDFGKIMMNSNPLLKNLVPMEHVPVEAREVSVEWIMMGAFFVLQFTVGEDEPVGNYHILIPSARGGTHWSRYHGNLEGVTDKTKEMALQASGISGQSVHHWLDDVIRKAALIELENK